MPPTRILLQTTLLPTDTDDWTISRFSFLRNYLSGLKDEAGESPVSGHCPRPQPRC
jgi:hypothetical protein